MAIIEQFSKHEIPYGILQKFGLTQEMIDDFPENVMNRFLSSRATPVLPVVTDNAEGQKVKTLARISLVRLEDGSVDVCFAPQWVDEDLTSFTQEQQEKLKLGEVTTAYVEGKGYCFVQFDDTINQVMTVPVDILNQNISLLRRSYGLNNDERVTLEQGGVVEIKVNDQILSAGIDLNDAKGIRIANGDIMAWQEDIKADKLPKYNFGIYGCWLADDDNILSYVAEDDYDQTLLAEQERAQSANAAEAQLNQLKY